MSKKKNRWVVYPDVEPTIGELKQHFNMQENEKLNPEELLNPKLTTLPVDTEELETEEKIMEGVEETLEAEEKLSEEELKELYIQQLKDSKKVFRPLSHPTKVVGTETVTSPIGRKRTVKIKNVQTNIITNKFDTAYKEKRKRKNKLAKASRRANRK